MNPSDAPQPLHGLVEAAARRWPDAIAVATTDRSITFAELDRLANQVAAMLRQEGLSRNSPVGILMRKGWEQAVAALGVLKAGGAYLPLDPELPARRVAQLVELGRCKTVLAQPRTVLQGVRVHPVSDGHLARLPAAPPDVAVEPGDLAYVLFTSGSTGTPKGVMIEHASAANTISDLNHRFALGPGDAILGLSSLSFDPSVYDLFGVLGAGATLVLPDPELIRDPAHWASLMERHDVTLWNSVPALLTMLVSWHEELGTVSRSPLQLAIVGGDVLPPDLPSRVRAVFPGVRLVNVYGPTEASICSTFYVVDQVDPGSARVPCGKPLSGQRILILDEDLKPVVDGASGEVCITGRGLARGYWRDDTRTRQAFVKYPLTGERIYRTGDQGRLLPDGNLEFLGRQDDQVKIRGYRIELGEIEAVLCRSPEVQRAAVVKTDIGLAGFVVARSNMDLEELSSTIQTLLPHYMVPDSLTVLAGLPLTQNGKVDRHALEAHAGIGEERSDRQPPRPGMEQRVAAILADLLGRESLGRTESFWGVGGNSLTATQLVIRLRRIIRADVPIGFAFTHPTIEHMAEALSALPSVPDEPAPERMADRARPARLSHAQEQVWFLDQLAAGNRAYHAQCTIRFSGQIDPELLRCALTEVARRHEILRTTFHDFGEGPVQVVHDPEPVALPVTDLRHLPAGERELVLEARVRQESDRSFDLERGPLVAWSMLRAADDDWLLVQTEHHLIHDGWSAACLWREVEEMYTAWEAGRDPELPELPIQFRDFSEWQRQWYSAARRAAALRYWRHQLRDVPSTDLAIAGQRPPRQTFVGSALRVEIPSDLYQRLRDYSTAAGVSLFATMFAAFAVLLHRYSGERDLCIGSWLANRDREETEHLIGMLVNMVALRCAVTAETSFRELVAHVWETTRHALEYQYTPFDDVVRELDVPRDPSRNPLVQSCFSFNDSRFPDFRWPRARGTFVERHNGSAKFDLNIVVVPVAEQRRNIVGPLGVGERLTLIWEFNTDLIAADSAERMVDHYIQLLTAAASGPDRAVDELPMLTTADLAAVPALSDATWDESPLLAAGDVVEMFRRHVARRPDAVAVDGVDGVRTYAEVHERAHVLAGRLIRYGVAPGDRVAVCVRRTSSLPVALLGTLMAGAAYVPLDPQHPRSRNQFIAADAGVRLVVTEPDLADDFPDQRLSFVDGNGVEELEQRTADAASPAYVIYTSGTTGVPKGVIVPHRALTNAMQAVQHLVQSTEDDVWLAVTTAAFDIAALELFLPLATGGRVVIAPEDAVANGEKLARLATSACATVMQATPMTWRILVEVGWRPPQSAFTILCGGEALAADLARELAARSTVCWNLYGPTETTIWSTAYRVLGDESHVPIGRPLLNTRIRIVDERGQPSPAGIPGELHLGGAGLALGYSSAELTASRFVQGWYRTGDVVRLRPDGQLEFLGRGDRQVKLHGYRIELEEIEQVLREHPDLRDCAVELLQDRLVGYVVPEHDSVSGENLATYLAAHVPRYMVPAQFVEVPVLPMSPNGKLDRSALPEPNAGPAPGGTVEEPATPAGPVEEQLAEIWSEVLGRKEIGAHEDFFSIGGHSLLAVLLVSRIRTQMNRDLQLEAVFDHPTVRRMASVLAGGSE